MTMLTDYPSPEHAGIYNRIREIGKVFDEGLQDEMGKLYAPLLANSPKHNVKVIKDIAYGPDKRNLLDVYSKMPGPRNPEPILVFFHGGGFTSGDKSYYKNIGNYFAMNNVMTIIPSYRLAPGHKWPSGAEDVAQVLKWIVLNAGTLGGDPKKIFMMGHSAGAAHVSSYLFFNEFHINPAVGMAGAILMSGPYYDAKYITGPCQAYYGEDESAYPGMSVIANIGNCGIPIFIIFAEYDPPEFDYQSIILFNAIYEYYKISPFIKRIINHNHISEVMQFNSGDCSIGPDILSFIKAIKN
jgi:acetyl esterase